MQRLLLDTHAFLWWVSEVDRLTAGARAAIAVRGTRSSSAPLPDGRSPSREPRAN